MSEEKKNKYTVRCYITSEEDDSLGEDDVEIEEYKTDHIEMAIFKWKEHWLKNPYMSEIFGSREDIQELLEWCNTHKRNFYLIGINGAKESEELLFQLSIKQFNEDVDDSLKTGTRYEVEDTEYVTARPFSIW